MQHAHPSRARCRGAASREAGFGLVEVLVTAVVVIVAGTAIFGGLDAASSASGRTKARSIASTLAQRDQERLRALDVDELNNLRSTYDDTSCDQDGKACTKYTVESRTQWISDTTGTASCSSTDAKADYLELISTVSWPNMRGATPVVMKSIYSPPVGSFGPTQGSLAVKLVGADGVTPKPGVQVRLTGPPSFADRTNALGCVVWGFLPAGNGYTIELDEPDYVDKQGIQKVTTTASVVGEALTTRSFVYDKYATARVSFTAQIGATVYPDQSAERITLGHSQMAPTSRLFPLVAPTSAQSAIATAPLFPFSATVPGGAYTIYAGGCTGQVPADGIPAFADLMPGDRDVPYALRLPAIDTKITVNGAAPQAAHQASYKIIQTTPGCTSAVTPALTPVPTSGTDAGRLMAMGRPYGTYTVCAQAKIGSVVYREAYKNVVIDKIGGIKVPSTGTPAGTINITTADTPPADCNAPIA